VRRWAKFYAWSMWFCGSFLRLRCYKTTISFYVLSGKILFYSFKIFCQAWLNVSWWFSFLFIWVVEFLSDLPTEFETLKNLRVWNISMFMTMLRKKSWMNGFNTMINFSYSLLLESSEWKYLVLMKWTPKL
jgi:hypothetical protein